MTALVICTKNSKCLPVLAVSVTFYLPDFYTVYLSGSDMIFPRHQTINLPNTATNFGDAYSIATQRAWDDGHEDAIICNDDVVLTPYTHDTLMEDLSIVPHEDLGWMAARSDYARGRQNIRYRNQEDQFGMKFASENNVYHVSVIAPIFAYIKREAWIDFPPLNWYSDDVQCLEMEKVGLKHYISRAYVHHVGSQTTGMDYAACKEEARPWLEANGYTNFL